jgi:tetratricopeptide (TPR) repeat protein
LLTYRKLGNQEATAGALLNIGASYYLLQQHESALANYKQSLEICQTHSLPYAEVTVCYNLAEALAGLGQRQEALLYWQQGYTLSQRAGFTDEITAFLQLRETTPALATTAIGASHSEQFTGVQGDVLVDAALSPEEGETLAMARRQGRISAKQLVDESYISRATATRRLTRLVELGYLVKQGEGRGTYYSLPTQPRLQPVEAVGETLHRVLQQCRAELQQQHTLSALGVAVPPTSLPLVKLMVRFEQTPDLARYLQLKRQLTDLLQMEVDLLVDDPLTLATNTETAWLWS